MMVRLSTCAVWSTNRRQKLRVLAAGVVPMKLHMKKIDATHSRIGKQRGSSPVERWL
jgi:hypothetical protein